MLFAVASATAVTGHFLLSDVSSSEHLELFGILLMACGAGVTFLGWC